MVQQSLSRPYTLSLFVTGVLKRRIQIVEIVHGSAVTIQALHSDVILHVPDGVYGVILGNIHTDHWSFRHLVTKKECIIGPICEFHIHGSNIQSKKPKFRLQIPHIMRNIEALDESIQVKFQQKTGEALQNAKPLEGITASDGVFYKLFSGHVEVLTDHFTTFIITAAEIECCCHSAAVLLFSGMNCESSPVIADIRLCFGSTHLKIKDYRSVNITFVTHA